MIFYNNKNRVFLQSVINVPYLYLVNFIKTSKSNGAVDEFSLFRFSLIITKKAKAISMRFLTPTFLLFPFK